MTTELSMNPNQLLNVKQTAELLSVSPSTINRWRLEGKGQGVVPIRIGNAVRYRYSDIEDYIQRKYENPENCSN
ncbi:MAG: helix-turn-helix transcriptional regulator [Alphaproteobacteria bacterium]